MAEKTIYVVVGRRVIDRILDIFGMSFFFMGPILLGFWTGSFFLEFFGFLVALFWAVGLLHKKAERSSFKTIDEAIEYLTSRRDETRKG